MGAFFQNPWVVGIGAGIVSGFVVYLITKWLFQRKDNSKHLEQISLANDEVIRILKPYVEEKGLPGNDIINAIIASTARKYNLLQNDIYSIRIICEELIKEIIENVYVSSDKKQEFSKNLNEYLLEIERPLNEDEISNSAKLQLEIFRMKSKYNYKNKYISYVSMILSVFVCIITVFGVIFSKNFSKISFNNDLDVFTIAAITTSVMVVTVSSLLFFSRIQERSSKIIRFNEEQNKKIDRNDI